MKFLVYVKLVIGLLILSTAAQAKTVSNDEMAQEVANLFLSIKIVLAESQPLINNADLGDKGLTPDVVIDKAMANYKKITGKTFSLSGDTKLSSYQTKLIAAAKTVMTEAQPLINMQGVGFKGFITAIFAKSLAKEFTKTSGGITFKFTAPKDRLRSSENTPDDWENNVFESKFKQSSWGKSKEFAETSGGQYRWMLPLYHDEGCMSCHGSPKGERDITGFSKEGAKVGDLAGAFSIAIK